MAAAISYPTLHRAERSLTGTHNLNVPRRGRSRSAAADPGGLADEARDGPGPRTREASPDEPSDGLRPRTWGASPHEGTRRAAGGEPKGARGSTPAQGPGDPYAGERMGGRRGWPQGAGGGTPGERTHTQGSAGMGQARARLARAGQRGLTGPGGGTGGSPQTREGRSGAADPGGARR